MLAETKFSKGSHPESEYLRFDWMLFFLVRMLMLFLCLDAEAFQAAHTVYSSGRRELSQDLRWRRLNPVEDSQELSAVPS